MKVLATRLIPPLVQKRLDSLKGVVMHQWKSMEEPMPRKELLQNVKDCHGILCLLTDKMDAELIDAAKELKVCWPLLLSLFNCNSYRLRKHSKNR